MNQDRIQGRWKEIKGKVRERWGRLTDDDLDVIAGRRDQLLGRIQQRHGLARDEAERQVREWEFRHRDHRFDKSQ
ncbi:MAG: CsbD family protein [Pseudomonadota bacterium]